MAEPERGRGRWNKDSRPGGRPSDPSVVIVPRVVRVDPPDPIRARRRVDWRTRRAVRPHEFTASGKGGEEGRNAASGGGTCGLWPHRPDLRTGRSRGRGLAGGSRAAWRCEVAPRACRAAPGRRQGRQGGSRAQGGRGLFRLRAFIGKRGFVTSRGASADPGVVAVLVGDCREPSPAALSAVPVDEAEHRGAAQLARLEDPREPNPSAELRDVTVANELEVRHRIRREAVSHRMASSVGNVPTTPGEDLKRSRVRGRRPCLDFMQEAPGAVQGGRRD